MSLVRAQQGEPKKRPPEPGGLVFASRSAGLKEFAGFASRNRRRIADEGKLRGGCRADAVEPQQGKPGKSTCFRKCFFSYIRLAASDIAFGSDISFASDIVLRTV